MKGLQTMRRCAALAVATSALFLTTTLLAAPGAHGPGGEHLDGQVQNSSAVSTAPRFEASSDLFEVVATLHHGELSLMIDRYTTNEPLLGAKVEVESGTLKALAKFNADEGDYAIDDAAFLQALTKPGEHALVITVSAGKDNDLLEGVLKVKVGGDNHADHGIARDAAWLWTIGAAAPLLVGAGAWIVRRRRIASTRGGAT